MPKNLNILKTTLIQPLYRIQFDINKMYIDNRYQYSRIDLNRSLYYCAVFFFDCIHYRKTFLYVSRKCITLLNHVSYHNQSKECHHCVEFTLVT